MNKNKIKVVLPLVALFICGVIVLLERYGITYQYTSPHTDLDTASYTEAVEQEKSCLLIYDANEEESLVFADTMKLILDDMRVGYDTLDVKDIIYPDTFTQYQTAVITFTDWRGFKDGLLELCQWVKAGGRLMNAVTPQPNSSFLAVSRKLGIESGGENYGGITGLRIIQDSMLGAKSGEVYPFSSGEKEVLNVSLALELDDESNLYIESEDGAIPLIWSRDYGEGQFTVVNDILTSKFQRGFLAFAYSTLEDAFIYPVINGSAYYLDDFPAPVPGGNSEYIKRDYGVDTSSFYSTVWWPKVLAWEETYGIRHTGLVIEEYSDVVKAPFATNQSTALFISFGNMLLNHGGEIGIHGYNHMPLCLKGIDEKRKYGEYKLWNSREDMEASLAEVMNFTKELYPSQEITVYVPPSNIMSETGREVLLRTCPSIKVIASTYLTDSESKVWEQEFGVGEDGIIDTPRIVSGCDIDDFAKITALSELNFHFVQSHFMHPDDVLDEDRGASLGWEELSRRFEKYLKWVQKEAPSVRNLTGSQLGQAVQQFDKLSLNRSLKDGILQVQLGGFSQEAYFLMRINEGVPESADGCEYEEVAADLYLVHAQKETFSITLGESM